MVRFRSNFLFVVLLSAVLCPVFATGAQPQGASSDASKKKASVAPKRKNKSAATSNTKKSRRRASRRRHSSWRFRRMRQAFVRSETLKPMAQQLLQNRTPAAYAGVEAYARKHNKEDAGSLAWLAIGYAHFLDQEYAKAIDPLNRAKVRAGDIGDYVAYYLAGSYLQSGRTAEAIAILSGFEKNYPASLLLRDARVQYANALVASSHPKEAIALLEKDRSPIRSDFELALGRAYEAAGDPAKAAEVLNHLYFTIPLSSEADAAESDLKKLAGKAGVVAPSWSDRKSRADALAQARRYLDAADAYRELLKEAGDADRPSLQLALAEALLHSDQSKEARRLLDSVPAASPEIAAQRLYEIGEIQRDADDDDGFLHTLGDLRQAAPTSPYLEQALLYAGNIYLLQPDYDKAIDCYRELEARFPNSPRAHYVHWKVAWLSLRQGRLEEAKKGFEEQIARYPDSNEVPAALYWRARLAEEDGDKGMAAAFYRKISERYRNYYYGPLARERMAKLNVGDDPPHFAILDHVSPLSTAPQVTDPTPPDDNLRLEKAHLLENGGMLDFAQREMKAAASEDKGDWLPGEMARMYEDAGRYDLAVEALKRAVPNYFAIDLSSLPRSYWEALFPRPYWADLKKFATANGLDPYLVASLIRQESEFNPNAVSAKNALGLMQLLPRVGRGMAKQVQLRHFSTAKLFTPAVNLQLGTRYFRAMVDQFGGLEYALAAYNAGDNRVRDWQANGRYRDVQEFVESIPFTETREYVQAIMRNANVYQQLYGEQ